MNFQQTLVFVTTIMGWVILAAALGFSVFIFAKIYMGRDKVAAEAKKAAELEKKKEKQESREAAKLKSGQINDTLAGNAELKKKLQARGQAPKREQVVSRLAETVKSTEEVTTSEKMKPMANFLDDDMDEFDFAKNKSSGQSQSNNKGFPPPPPRF